MFSLVDFRSFPSQLDDHSTICPSEELFPKQEPLCEDVDLLVANPKSSLLGF